MSECFIIMPISTYDSSLYSSDTDHFAHVLECLFIPSITKVGMKPISPIMEGSDIIHGEVIKNIENADLVLCDMSTLNPNVFFELGIRTAVNKPVCLVKDDVTSKVPFDTSVINYHSYQSSLTAWNIESQITSLATHIQKSNTKSNNQNSMWKYFGLSTRSRLSDGKTNIDDRLEIISMQLESMNKMIDGNGSRNQRVLLQPNPTGEHLYSKLHEIATNSGINVFDASWDELERKMIIVTNSNQLTIKIRKQMLDIAGEFGFKLVFRQPLPRY